MEPGVPIGNWRRRQKWEDPQKLTAYLFWNAQHKTIKRPYLNKTVSVKTATKQKEGAREMTPLLRALFVLSEDPGLIARTHMW